MIRVLIIDDHDIVRHGLKQLLAGGFSGLEFGEAKNSQEAMELAQRQEWDLALLDINIPGRNGLEVLEDFRRLQPKTRVLVLSAYPEEEFAIRSIKLGASGYLNKNSAIDEVIVAVKRMIAGGSYITPSLAEKLAEAMGGRIGLTAHESLSGRELQVLRLVAAGKTVKQIAAELSLSEKTIGTYRTRISRKLGLATNVELARYAIQHRLVD